MNTKEFASQLLNASKNVEPINNNNDYCRVKRWRNKAVFLYSFFSLIALIGTVLFSGEPGMAIPVVAFVDILTAWGFATLFLNFKLFFKSSASAMRKGNKIGEQIQTQHVQVRHEFGDTYRVNTYTENKGCFVAMIFFWLNFIVFGTLGIYVCPFLTFAKIKRTTDNLNNYKNTNR